MSTFDLVFGMVLILIGVLFALFAGRLVPLFDWESPRVRLVRSALGIVGGVALILAAWASRSPDLFRWLGTWAVVGSIGLMLMPMRLWVRVARWLTREHLTFYRLITLTVLTLLGGIIIYSAFP